MSNIPTIPNSQRIQDQQIGVHVGARPGLQRLQAEKDVWNSATNAVVTGMDVVQDYEERKRRAEEVAAFNKASIVMNKATEDFTHKLRTIPDQQVVPNWTAYSKQVADQALTASGLEGPAKTRLMQHLATWQSDSTINFQVAADMLGSQRRMSTAAAAAHEFLKSGDPATMDNAKAAVDAAVKAGDWTPEHAKLFTDQFPSVLQENQIRNGMEADPFNTLKDINAGKFKSVPSGPMATLRRQTQAAVARQQNAGRDDLSRRLDDGEIIDEAELKQKEDIGVISPEGAKSIRSRIAQNGLAEAKDSQRRMMTDVQDYDFTADKDADGTAQKMKDRAAALPTALRVPLVEKIDNRLAASKKPGEDTENPIIKKELGYMREDFNSGSSFVGVRGGTRRIAEMPDADFQKEFGKDAKRQDVIDQARLSYAKKQHEFLEWSKTEQGKKASAEDAAEYRRKLEQPDVDAKVKEQLGLPSTGFTKGKTYKDGKGNKAVWNGQSFDPVRTDKDGMVNETLK